MRGLLILMVAVTAAYLDRSAIAHITPIVLKAGLFSRGELAWVLSAFGWGYVVGLPFSGLLLARLGHGRVLGIIGVGWAASGLAFSFCNTWIGLAACRFGLGLFEAPLFPLFVSWVALESKGDRSPQKISLVEGCSYVGMACAGPVTIALAQAVGWRGAYAAVSLAGVLVSLLSRWLPAVGEGAPPVRARAAKGAEVSPTLIAVALGFLLYNMAKAFYSTWFPTVLTQHFGYSSWSSAIVTTLQAIAGPLASVAATTVSIALLRRGRSLASARLSPLVTGFLVAACLPLALWRPDVVGPVSVLAFTGLISTSALIWNAVPDLTEAHKVGLTAGWVNAIANLGTSFSPLLIGRLMEEGATPVLLAVGLTCVATIPAFFLAYRWRRQAVVQ